MTTIISPVSILGSQAPRLKSLPPLSLYIHLPWCMKKCPYCDFNSHEVREQSGGMQEAEYVAALIRDLEGALPQVWGRKVVSVFFGGGTPSLFSARSIDTILAAVRALLPLEHFAEITLEANPGTFEVQKFADFRAAGINRLSIGIQSFNPGHLRSLGRIHDDSDARRRDRDRAEKFRQCESRSDVRTARSDAGGGQKRYRDGGCVRCRAYIRLSS